MNALWRLEVEGLGKIERAEMDVRPLMLLVGPNNTGKTYLASLLWGLIAMQTDLDPTQGAERDAVDAWVAARIVEGKAPITYELTADDIALFHRYFETLLDANRATLVNRIFKSDSVAPPKVSFRRVANAGNAKLSWSIAENGASTFVVSDHGEKGRNLQTQPSTRNLDELRSIVRDMLTRRLTFSTLTRLFRPFTGEYSSIDPIYLPASRTGFMQLYKAAARRSLRDAHWREREEEPDEWLDITTPSFHFLELITFGLKDNQPGRFVEEALFLEQAMTGRMDLTSPETGVNEYRYYPPGAASALPMKLSSALVTELGPLILVLRHAKSLPLLVLEEPEAHLHPELQRKLAQVIVRLIRKGLFVWITTHSENLCQEINNFIKIGSLPLEKRNEAQKKLGYCPQDYLDLDDVSGYGLNLTTNGERSNAAEMKRTPAGLVMPTFNRAIVKLSRDVAYLDDLLAQEGV